MPTDEWDWDRIVALREGLVALIESDAEFSVAAYDAIEEVNEHDDARRRAYLEAHPRTGPALFLKPLLAANPLEGANDAD